MEVHANGDVVEREVGIGSAWFEGKLGVFLSVPYHMAFVKANRLLALRFAVVNVIGCI